MSFVTQAVIGKQKQVTVYGNDYDRTDGSCVKDHIHVVDLAEAHVKSCSRMIANKSEAAHEVFNVWTGVGYTVLEVINACEKENQIKLNYTIGKRREGDAQVIFADVTKANSILQWKTEKHLKDMVIDSWRWEKGLNK